MGRPVLCTTAFRITLVVTWGEGTMKKRRAVLPVHLALRGAAPRPRLQTAREDEKTGRASLDGSTRPAHAPLVGDRRVPVRGGLDRGRRRIPAQEPEGETPPTPEDREVSRPLRSLGTAL